MDVLASVRQPSTFRMLIWPEASNAQNSIAAVSADGSTVCVLIRRLNSSCRRSIALVVRALRHWLGGSRVKVKRRSPASSRLSATARHLSRHLRMKALRRLYFEGFFRTPCGSLRSRRQAPHPLASTNPPDLHSFNRLQRPAMRTLNPLRAEAL